MPKMFLKKICEHHMPNIVDIDDIVDDISQHIDVPNKFLVINRTKIKWFVHRFASHQIKND